MGNSYNLNSLWVAGALSLSSALPVCGATTTIFDNTTRDPRVRLDPGSTQVGDEIILTTNNWYLQNFSFEYWGTNSASPANTVWSGNVQAEVRMYLMNGAPFNGFATPGTVLYDSGLFSVPSPTPRSTFVFTAGHDNLPLVGLFLPSRDITWSVQFTGMGATDHVGVDIYNSFDQPSVGIGQDYPDYWANTGGWTLLTNTISMDFAAQFNATANIPEPSVVTLSVIGGLGILAFASKLRRKE
jgi:hypothetical protein